MILLNFIPDDNAYYKFSDLVVMHIIICFVYIDILVFLLFSLVDLDEMTHPLLLLLYLCFPLVFYLVVAAKTVMGNVRSRLVMTVLEGHWEIDQTFRTAIFLGTIVFTVYPTLLSPPCAFITVHDVSFLLDLPEELWAPPAPPTFPTYTPWSEESDDEDDDGSFVGSHLPDLD